MVSSSCWVGEIPVTVSCDDEPTQQTIAYWINFDKTLYVDNTYLEGAAPVIDNGKWKSASYLLTWHNLATDDNVAAANQVAIWRILDFDNVKTIWLYTSIDNAGMNLATA